MAYEGSYDLLEWQHNRITGGNFINTSYNKDDIAKANKSYQKFLGGSDIDERHCSTCKYRFYCFTNKIRVEYG